MGSCVRACAHIPVCVSECECVRVCLCTCVLVLVLAHVRGSVFNFLHIVSVKRWYSLFAS